MRQCCNSTVSKGSAQPPSFKPKTTSRLPSLCRLPAWAACERMPLSCFGLNPAPWCPQMAADKLPSLDTRTRCAVLVTRSLWSLVPRARPLDSLPCWIPIRLVRPPVLATPRSLATVET